MIAAGLRRAPAAALLVAFAIGVWLVSPRFSVGGPSLIDDWFAIRVTPTRVGSLGRLLSPQDGHFFPGASAWGYLQWHTLGAPGNMLGPNAWDVGHVSVFVVGVGLFTYLLGRFGDARSAGASVVRAMIAPLLVVSTPGVAVDFARFEPQEVRAVARRREQPNLPGPGWLLMLVGGPRPVKAWPTPEGLTGCGRRPCWERPGHGVRSVLTLETRATSRAGARLVRFASGRQVEAHRQAAVALADLHEAVSLVERDGRRLRFDAQRNRGETRCSRAFEKRVEQLLAEPVAAA